MSVLRRTPMLALALASVLAPSTVRADTFQAPGEVMAAADGWFSYEVFYRKGPGAAQFGGTEYFGDANVDAAEIGDGFCITTIEPGWSFTLNVHGKLKNPALNGSVFQQVSICGEGGGSSRTTIRAFDPLGVVGPGSGRDAVLWNEPNPFIARTTFHFGLPQAGPVSLGIYDVAGRLLARVVDGALPAGPHEIAWDRSALNVAAKSSGVLFARLSFGGRVQMRRMVLLR